MNSLCRPRIFMMVGSCNSATCCNSVVRSQIPKQLSTGYSRSVVADPEQETADANRTEGYSIGEIDLECWRRLWKVRTSALQVDAEEGVVFLTGLLQLAASSFRTIKYWSGFADDF